MTLTAPSRPLFHVLLALLAAFLSPPAQGAESRLPAYELAVAFDLAQGKLFGTAHITIPAGSPFTVDLGQLTPTAAVLQKAATPPREYSAVTPRTRLTVAAEPVPRELFISYEKTVGEGGENSLGPEGIVLLDDWYPHPLERVLFSLAAELPPGFSAVAESDRLPGADANLARFSFSEPRRSLHFIAAPFQVFQREVRPGLSAYAYFLSGNEDLADSYLAAAATHLRRYEELIGPYPYNHFVIVENFRPTGYGMPTFTLLGSSVIRLPFIKDTSLGHEILHSWFGSSVGVTGDSGNWCEGLTTYLSDWLYREEMGEGALVRKENILKYHSYVTPETVIPLARFQSASHSQPMARAKRSVGYIRGAMLFHELQRQVGAVDFSRALKRFYARFKGSEASWQDIRETFESVTGEELADFFRQRLQRTDIPDFEIEAISPEPAEGRLRFTLRQKTETPFSFLLPIEVETALGTESFQVRVDSARQEVELRLQAAAQAIRLDPRYDLLRTLDNGERVAPLSLFLGPAEVKLHVAAADRARFAPLQRFAAARGWRELDEASAALSTDSPNLVLAGRDNPVTAALFGSLAHPRRGVTLETRRHPLAPGSSVLLVSADDETALRGVLPRLHHFGKYTRLHFEDGRAEERTFSPGTMGRRYELAPEPLALPAAGTVAFKDILPALAANRVVYVGERHTSMADHLLQYHIIRGLHRFDPNIAIAMEMFPTDSQEALRRYIQDPDQDERTFLKESGYFRVWSFDYRYYRRIINYAREHGIPLLGLNIERDIVNKVFREGSLAGLSEEERARIPEGRDLSLPGYYDKLRSMHGLHGQGIHGGGSLGGFIQAQAVWDEVMAANLVRYLRANPARRVIVLAGGEHARKDNGIPPRVERRLEGIRQSTVLSLASAGRPDPAEADYFIAAPAAELPPGGKIGISLAESEEKGDTLLTVEAISPGSNAGTAGLRPGDRLLAIAGFPVSTMEDVRIAMLPGRPGDRVVVAVERPSSWSEPQRLEVTVELYSPASEQ